MKIAFVISGFSIGGGKNAYYSVIEYVAKQEGVEIFIIGFGSKGPNYSKFQGLTSEIHFFGLRELSKLNNLLRKNGIAKVMVDAFWPSLIVRLSSIIFRGFPKVLYRFGAITYDTRKDFLYRFILYRQRIVVPALSLERYLNKSLFRPKSVTVVTNHIPPVRRGDAEKDPNLVITVARAIERKRVDRVFSFALQFKDLNFVVLGGGKLLQQHKEELIKQGIQNVEFVGETTDVQSYYDRAMAMFLPSRGEGLSYSIYEALFSKCKVVVYEDMGGNNDYLRDNPNYYILKDVDDFETFERMRSSVFTEAEIKTNTLDEMGEKYFGLIVGK